MTFKVIMTYPSIDDDEHTYYGMVFLKNGQSQLKRLNLVEDIKKRLFLLLMEALLRIMKTIWLYCYRSMKVKL